MVQMLQMWEGGGPAPVQMWRAVSPVPVQMWEGGKPSPGADVAWGEPSPGADKAGARMWRWRAGVITTNVATADIRIRIVSES